MGGVSSRDHSITTAEDRRPGAYHRAKNLDPLCEGLPLEEGLRLGLDSAALLKKSQAKNSTPCRETEVVARLKHSSKTIPGRLSDRKTNTENQNKEK
jgi:hypothetical protein